MTDIVNDLGATSAEDAKIKTYPCGHCDFGFGRRGMDRCSKCGGIGSYLMFDGVTYENTREGYRDALTALRKKEPTT